MSAPGVCRLRDDSQQPRIGVGLIVRSGTRLLLVRRHGSHGAGSWSTPGGNLDWGEDPVMCAVREAREETGVEVAAPRFVAVTNDLFEAEAKHYVTLWFEAEHTGGRLAPVPEKWEEMSLPELLKLCASAKRVVRCGLR